MIFVCEPCVRGASHEKVNSAFLECVRLAFPREAIGCFADASHIAALKRIAAVDGLDFSAVDFVALRVGDPEGPVQFVRYRSQLRMIFDQALAANVPRILFLSANPAVQLQAKHLQTSARYSGLHLCFVLHAGFEAIATDKVEALPLLPMPGSSQRVREVAREKGLRHVVRAAVRRLASSANIAARGWNWLTRRYLGVRRVMEWRHSDKISYIALSPHVITNAKKYLDPAALNINAVALPTVFRNFTPHVSTDYVRFAVFGYGNTPMLYSVMTRLTACAVKRPYEVRIIGMDNRGMSRFPRVTAVSPGRFMERHEMEKHVADIDMFLILYDRSRYRLSCSNSVMEALSYRKPILHLHNDCIDYFNSPELPIGYRVEDEAACAELMAEIINNFPSRRVDLEEFSRNIDILRSRYSLANAASAIRAHCNPDRSLVDKKNACQQDAAMKVSVVICVKNEEARLRDCLALVERNQPDEIIVVDGNSTDRTVAIAREFPGVQVIESGSSTLTRDRQKGIDAARNALIAMIDADHRLRPGDLASLVADMQEFNFDIVQSGLVAYENHGFWDAAEEATWHLTHNIPGPKRMIGTAPAIYKKRVFDHVRFDDHITKTIDDTDFAYRLSKVPSLKFGIGRTNIRQFHFATFSDYVRKFRWYGKGDGEFCHKNPERAPSMFYHLLVRYPLVYSWRAIRNGQPKAVPFFVLQGLVRFYGLSSYLIKRAVGPRAG